MSQTSSAPTATDATRNLPLFWPAFALALLVMAAFRVIDVPLQTPSAPNGIVSYELAGSAPAAQAMIDSWDAQARLYAAFGLGLDYLFMLSYALAIGLGAAWAGRQLGSGRRWPVSLGRVLAWGLGLAALLDAVENIALLKMLLVGTASAPWPAVAAVCATIKFALVLAGLVYVLAGVVRWLIARLR